VHGNFLVPKLVFLNRFAFQIVAQFLSGTRNSYPHLVKLFKQHLTNSQL